MPFQDLKPHPRRVARAAMLAAVLQFGCPSAADWYPHDLPVVYRARAYGADVATTTAACVAALSADGYRVVAADSLSGVVYTSAKVVAPDSPEIGGEWQLTCFVEIRDVQEKSLVVMELLAEGGGFTGIAPIEFDLKRARGLYEDLFALLSMELETRRMR